jgi:hypothetical protein
MMGSFMVAAFLGMTAPLNAIGGITTGYFWERSSWWGVVSLSVTLAIAAPPVLGARSLDSHPE